MTTRIILFFTLFATPLLAQKSEKFIFLGEEAEKAQDLIKAAEIYEKGVKKLPEDLKLHFKYAEVLRNLADYERAEKYYRKTIELDSQNEYPAALYWLASIEKNNENYAQSLADWELLARQFSTNQQSIIYQKAIQEIKACQFVMSDSFPRYENGIRNILNLNTTDAEFASSYYDTSSLVFSQLLKVTQDRPQTAINLRSARRLNGDWEPLGELPLIINTPNDQNANGQFSSDGKYFVFSRCEGLKPCQVFISYYQNGKYSKAFPVKTNVADYASTQPNLTKTKDGYLLFFSSNRPGGKGGYDIWCSEADENLALKPAFNLSSINSAEDEISPFYHPQTEELFFSSTWHAGLGGYDIFKSRRNENGSFAEPINMGSPFNSPANDFYFTLSPTGYKGTLTSNRAGSLSTFGKTCCNDLYEFDYPVRLIEKKPPPAPEPPIPLASADSTLKEMERLLPLRLYFHNDEPDPRSKRSFTLKTYENCYFDYLKVRGDYEKQQPTTTDSLFVHYVQRGYDQIKDWMDQCLIALQAGQSVEVDIRGFASPLAKNQYNINLSNRRIESFYNYIKKYRDGAFLPFLNGNGAAQLRFNRLPFGEEKANQGVSDDYYNQKLSVFSLEAALERRIELVAMRTIDNNTIATKSTMEGLVDSSNQANAYPAGSSWLNDLENSAIKSDSASAQVADNKSAQKQIEANETEKQSSIQPPANDPKTTATDMPGNGMAANPSPALDASSKVYTTNRIEIDLGRVKRGTQVVKTIRFRNTFGTNITMTKVKTDCSCSGLAVPTPLLVPDEEIEFTLVYDTRGKVGPQDELITVFTKEISGQITIRFKAEVIP
ncbi:MAG TPA: DUF1573 domain-containing protein [Luteibaculaceae bacterium]|nr:DUF1573 domain-containing protein [Luteibaculaceae bacterium]